MAEDLETNGSPNHKVYLYLKELVDPRMGGERGEDILKSSIWDVRNSLCIDPGRSDVV